MAAQKRLAQDDNFKLSHYPKVRSQKAKVKARFGRVRSNWFYFRILTSYF